MANLDPTPAPSALPPPLALLQMAAGYWLSQMIYVAAKLGLADLLTDGPRKAEELAKTADANPRSISRLMRGLASVGIFAGRDDGRFELTPLAEPLREGVPNSMRWFIIMLGEEHYQAWGSLLHSVKTGEVAWEHVFKSPIFPYFAQHPESGHTFNQAMADFTALGALGVLMAYDFSPIQTLVDVGAGHGTLLTTLLTANRDIKGILYDTAQAVEVARKQIEAAGLAGRCEAVSGDILKSVPAGADAYILKNVIHDWDDSRAVTILKNCGRAMAPNGRVLLVELIVPPGNEPSFAKLLDINMLVVSGGFERTEAEYRALFKAAGMQLTNIIATLSPVSIIEGVRATKK